MTRPAFDIPYHSFTAIPFDVCHNCADDKTLWVGRKRGEPLDQLDAAMLNHGVPVAFAFEDDGSLVIPLYLRAVPKHLGLLPRE